MWLPALVSLAVGWGAAVACVYLITEGFWGQGLLAHALSLLPAALGLRLWLRLVGCNQTGLYPLTLAITALIPGFGLLSVPLAAVYGARNPVPVEEEETMTVEVPRLPFKPLAMDHSLSFSRGGLFEVLERSSDTEKQVVAVMATTRMKAKQAVPLLKVAMRDEADDVRLLAYSIKDRKESEINSKIKGLIQVLEEDGTQTGKKPLTARERAATERSLAFLYWELIYLDLAEGDIRDYFLEQVVQRAEASLDVMAYGPLSVLLGRAYMERGHYDQASDAFEQAERSGVERLTLAPYRAEIAFHERRFAEVRTRLMEVGASPHEAMREVLDFWLKTA